MAGIILEGVRSGKGLDTTERNMARSLDISLGPQHFTTQADALAWTLQTTQTPTGALDIFFYLRNEDPQRDLIVTRVQANAGTAETIDVLFVTGTPAGGTDAGAPLSRNAGVGLTFQGVVQGGSDITNLTDSGVFEKLFVPAGGKDSINLLERPIILPAGQAQNIGVALRAVTGAIQVTALMDVMVQTYDPRG